MPAIATRPLVNHGIGPRIPDRTRARPAVSGAYGRVSRATTAVSARPQRLRFARRAITVTAATTSPAPGSGNTVTACDKTVRRTTSEVRANTLQRWRTGGGSAYRGTVRDHLPPGLPPDPFAGDPSDPSAALDAIEPGEPLDPHERLAVEEDLADLAVYEALLAHRGIRGLVVSCEDCRQDHYHDWDMLRANLLQLLVDGTVRPHEPAYDPTPEAYVTWDYCRGYADASMNEALHGDGFDGFDV